MAKGWKEFADVILFGPDQSSYWYIVNFISLILVSQFRPNNTKKFHEVEQINNFPHTIFLVAHKMSEFVLLKTFRSFCIIRHIPMSYKLLIRLQYIVYNMYKCTLYRGLFFVTCKLTCTFTCNVSRILRNDCKKLKFCGTLVQCIY